MDGQKKVKINEEELSALKESAAKAEECAEKMLRMQADFENRKKRQDKEKLDFQKFANEGMITELLRVMDDFERAIDSAKNTNDTKVLLQGIEMVRRDFEDILKESGLKVIDPAGQPFDPERHEAVEHAEDVVHPENTVLEVLRKGYELNGKVLRPAAVKVSNKKEEETKEEAKEEKSEEEK
ncbi:MAG TPA: nucleotide exchange factor GrpE [Candidatus Omnitrophota bacterium]|nr:nucleotide exchange factor GrpE [Candidatus Omnitrophota bacterium]HOX09763.1 nucleotide exchange factor GrpE [Candidatus Omnitrophota bacterium]HPN66437.1 nucleotide exchange factor GrpE [Candidatus Omnitrophota bacterium]